MRRQRRYKACDPFAHENHRNKNKNGGGVKESMYDLAPKKKGNDFDDDHFTESKRFQDVQRGIERAMAMGKKGQKRSNLNSDVHSCETPTSNKKKKKGKRKDAEEGMLKTQEQQPNETKKQYFQRLDQKVNDAINQSMMESRTLRKKRKLHLKARDEKRKKQKKGGVVLEEYANGVGETNNTNYISQDTFKFGESVDEPPELTAAPRKATINPNKLKSLKLMSILENNKNDKNTKNKKNNNNKVELSGEALEEERQRVIDAYRLMNKRKQARDKT